MADDLDQAARERAVALGQAAGLRTRARLAVLAASEPSRHSRAVVVAAELFSAEVAFHEAGRVGRVGQVMLVPAQADVDVIEEVYAVWVEELNRDSEALGTKNRQIEIMSRKRDEGFEVVVELWR